MKPRHRIRSGTFNRPAGAGGARSYAGGNMSRLTNDWVATMKSEDAAARSSMVRMRERARQLTRDDDYAKKFLWLADVNIVGPSGVKLQMNVQRPEAGKLVADEENNDRIEAAWEEFSTPEQFSVTGTLTRRDVEGLAVKTAARDGEYLLRLIKGPSAGNEYGFAIQPLEVDHLDHDYNANLRNGNQVRMGIEFNQWRRPVAYHIFSDHPGDLMFFGRSGMQRVRVPADEVIHGFVPMFMQQTRGITWFHTSMTRMHMLHGYEEAEVVAARTASSKMGFFTRKLNADGTAPGPYTGDGEEDGNIISEAEPGAFEQLPVGMEFSQWDPSHPTTEFANFRKAMLRGVSAGLLVSYNSLGSDLEGVNFSSIRAGVLEDRDIWMLLQGWVCARLEKRIFTEWLRHSIMTGAVPGSLVDFKRLNRPRFICRRWSWVDPVKEVTAAITAINAHLKTHGDVIAESGGDFAETMKRIRRERETAEEEGVDLTMNSEATPTAPASTPPNEDEDDDPPAGRPARVESLNGHSRIITT